MPKLSCSLYSFDPHKASDLPPLDKNRFLLNQGKFWKTDYSGRFRIVMVAIKRNVTSIEERNFLKKRCRYKFSILTLLFPISGLTTSLSTIKKLPKNQSLLKKRRRIHRCQNCPLHSTHSTLTNTTNRFRTVLLPRNRNSIPPKNFFVFVRRPRPHSVVLSSPPAINQRIIDDKPARFFTAISRMCNEPGDFHEGPGGWGGTEPSPP
jgi:hypothetical protein